MGQSGQTEPVFSLECYFTPSRLPDELLDAFQAYSLSREIQQTNLIFYAFGLFALANLVVDALNGNLIFVVLHAFFVGITLVGIRFINRISVHQHLVTTVNTVSLLLVSALLLTKANIGPDDWFIYFADILVITTMMLSLPILPWLKLG